MIINNIREEIKNNIGRKIRVKVYGSRNKKDQYVGYIDQVYLNIFVIKLENEEIKSFSYTDVLTKNVQLSFLN